MNKTHSRYRGVFVMRSKLPDPDAMPDSVHCKDKGAGLIQFLIPLFLKTQ